MNPPDKKAWWLPIGNLIAATITKWGATEGTATKAPLLGNIAEALRASQPIEGVDAHALGIALEACINGRTGCWRKSLPTGNSLARAIWRHAQFKAGVNVNLGGLFAAQCDDPSGAASDFIDVLWIVAQLPDRGAERWRRAIHG